MEQFIEDKLMQKPQLITQSHELKEYRHISCKGTYYYGDEV